MSGWWSRKLSSEGMGQEIGYENDSNVIRLGHGVKSKKWEDREDNGEHSPYCPNVLGRGELDQSNDRPTEDAVEA